MGKPETHPFPMKFPLADNGYFADGGIVPNAPKFEDFDPLSYLEGFHRQTGQWVVLMRMNGLNHEEVFRKLATSTQPSIERGYIRIEDFSAFKAEDRVVIRFQ